MITNKYKPINLTLSFYMIRVWATSAATHVYAILSRVKDINIKYFLYIVISNTSKNKYRSNNKNITLKYKIQQ